MEKIVKTLIDNALEGVDVYFNNGSIWLIFTETKEWVLELEKNGHLWYNHYFFRNLFSYLSMDVVENQKYITKYVEDALQNGVKYTRTNATLSPLGVEDALQNGVKYTWVNTEKPGHSVEDVLQNGVKNTVSQQNLLPYQVEDALQNGVKYTWVNTEKPGHSVEDVLQNGVKYTRTNATLSPLGVEDALQNGEKI